MKVHDLKCWPSEFIPLRDGHKKFEFRKDDRDFGICDILVLREWLPESYRYTGEVITRRVTYVLHGPNFGVPDGFVVMSVESLP